MTVSPHRPPTIDLADIVREGRRIGLRDLSLASVAKGLGVSSAALYRHVEGRWGLESLVGEDILSEAVLPEGGVGSVEDHLVNLAMGVYEFAGEHPGLASYLQTLFPRGEEGRRVLSEMAAGLVPYGYDVEMSMVLAVAVCTLAIGYACAADDHRARIDGLQAQHERSVTAMHHDDRVAAALADLPEVPDEVYVRLWLGAAIDGFVRAAPAGVPAQEVLTSMCRRFAPATPTDTRNDTPGEGRAR